MCVGGCVGVCERDGGRDICVNYKGVFSSSS